MYGESIYNLVPVEVPLPEKRPYPKSTGNHSTNIPGSTFGCHGTTRPLGAGKVVKKDGAIFGPPKPESGLTRTSPNRDTSELQKSSEPFHYADKTRASIPKRNERPIMGITTNKNFITANAVEAILQAPKRSTEKELNYSRKEDFGKVPAYLTQVKEEIRRENEMIERYVKQQMGEVEKTPETFEELTEDERLDLIDALKSKWDHVNAQYQKFTHLVVLDTAGSIRRKEQFENELQQLENDIEKLQGAGSVLIRK